MSTLDQKIIALENEIAHCWTLHDAAETIEDKRIYAGLITSARNNLDKLLAQQNQSSSGK